MFDRDGRPVEYLNWVDSARVVMEQTGKGRASAFAPQRVVTATSAAFTPADRPDRSAPPPMSSPSSLPA